MAGRGHDVAVIECEPDPGTADSGEAGDGDAAHTDASELALRFWLAERQMVRDRLAANGVAVARWAGEGHLDVVLDELKRRRTRPTQAGRR